MKQAGQVVLQTVYVQKQKKYSPLLAYLKVLSILWGEWWLYCKLPSCWVHQNKGRTSWHQLVRGQWPLCSLGINTDTMQAVASDNPCVSIALGDMSHVIITTTVSFHESRLKDYQISVKGLLEFWGYPTQSRWATKRQTHAHPEGCFCVGSCEQVCPFTEWRSISSHPCFCPAGTFHVYTTARTELFIFRQNGCWAFSLVREMSAWSKAPFWGLRK